MLDIQIYESGSTDYEVVRREMDCNECQACITCFNFICHCFQICIIYECLVLICEKVSTEVSRQEITVSCATADTATL